MIMSSKIASTLIWSRCVQTGAHHQMAQTSVFNPQSSIYIFSQWVKEQFCTKLIMTIYSAAMFMQFLIVSLISCFIVMHYIFTICQKYNNQHDSIDSSSIYIKGSQLFCKRIQITVRWEELLRKRPFDNYLNKPYDYGGKKSFFKKEKQTWNYTADFELM